MPRIDEGLRRRAAVDGIAFASSVGRPSACWPKARANPPRCSMIACRTPRTGGEWRVEGFGRAACRARIRSLIGVVPQENNLDPDISVRQICSLCALLSTPARAGRRAEATNCCASSCLTRAPRRASRTVRRHETPSDDCPRAAA